MKIKNVLLSVVGTLLVIPAYAATQDIKSVNNQVGLQLTTIDVDYLEKESGEKLDSEGGHVPGFSLSLSLMKDVLFTNDYFHAEYSRNKGHTDYVGQYISGGGYGSLKDSSKAKLTDYSFRYGKGFELGESFMLTPYAEIGQHEWERGVNDGETYKNKWWGLGVLAQYSPIQKFVVGVDAMLGRTFDSKIDVKGSYGFNDSLGKSDIYRVGISGDYAITEHIHANVGVDYVNYKYGKSGYNEVAADPGYLYYEPNSKTENTTFKIGVGYSF